MKKTLLIIPVTLLLLAGCNEVQTTTSPSSSKPPVTASPASKKFTDQSYYNKSYLISEDTLNEDAQKAISGFKLDKQSLLDGTKQITLKALNPEYHDQAYTLKTGEQLYFIEKFMGDEPTIEDEKNLKDDTAVVVDSQGFVTQEPRDFAQ